MTAGNAIRGLLPVVVAGILAACASPLALDPTTQSSLQSIALVATRSTLDSSSDWQATGWLAAARGDVVVKLNLRRPSQESYYTRDDMKRVIAAVAKAYLEQARDLFARTFTLRLDLQADDQGMISEWVVADRSTNIIEYSPLGSKGIETTRYRLVTKQKAISASVTLSRRKLFALPPEDLSFEALRAAMTSCSICE